MNGGRRWSALYRRNIRYPAIELRKQTSGEPTTFDKIAFTVNCGKQGGTSWARR